MAADDGGTLAITGASYARGWGVDSLAGRRVINTAVDGQESHEVLARFQGDVIARAPEAVIIWGFINDFFRADRNSLDQVKARARESLQQMVNAARVAGITPILATEIPIRGPKTLSEEVVGFVAGLLGKESYQHYINEQVVEINRWVVSFAADHDVAVLDFYGVLAGDDGFRRRAYATKDGSHITEAGYAAITEYAQGRLPTLLE